MTVNASNASIGAAGLGERVTVTQRDIEGQGFPDSLHGKADAVFLDLPGPWKVGSWCVMLCNLAAPGLGVGVDGPDGIAQSVPSAFAVCHALQN